MSLRDAIRAAIGTEQHARKVEELRQIEEMLRRARVPWLQGHETLYKFKGFAGEHRHHVLDILDNSRIYLSSADQINDPYDVAPVVRLAGDPKDPEFLRKVEAEQERFVRRAGWTEERLKAEMATGSVPIEGLPAAITKSVRESLRSGTRMYCLTLERHHPLHWAHYADGHRGLCLHFACHQEALFGSAHEVVYQANRLPLLVPMTALDEAEVYDRIALVKADYWSYEHEYRLVVADDVDPTVRRDGDYLKFDPAELTGITLGMRMNDPDREELLRHADPKLPIWEAYEDEDRYWMLSRRIR